MIGRELRKSPWWCICARRSAVQGMARWRRGNWGRRDHTLSCDLRLRATPVQIALPYIACDLPLVERRPPLVSQREIQEISRVDLAREMGVGPPLRDHGLSPGATWTINTQSIIGGPPKGRGLAAVDDLLRPNHCSTPLSRGSFPFAEQAFAHGNRCRLLTG